jgi:hypothetical protein
MKPSIQRSLSKLRLPKSVAQAAIDQWDFETEEGINGLTGPRFTDKEILDLDDANLTPKEVYAFLHNDCRFIGSRIAAEVAEIIVVRIKNTAKYIRDDIALKQSLTKKLTKKQVKGTKKLYASGKKL